MILKRGSLFLFEGEVYILLRAVANDEFTGNLDAELYHHSNWNRYHDIPIGEIEPITKEEHPEYFL